MNKKIMFMGNGDYKNNGCEAITRGTLDILRKTFPNYKFVDSYFKYHKNDNEKFLGNDVDSKPVFYPERWTLKWFILQIALNFFNNKIGDLLYSNCKKNIDESSAILSLGGDNYSLDYGVPKRFLAMGDYIKKRQKPFIIWGASIGPFDGESDFEDKLIKHFNNSVDLIFVREEESFKYLCYKGLSSKTHLMADPAFMMTPQKCNNNEIGFSLPDNFIAINFSDLMSAYVTNGNTEEWKIICLEFVTKIYEKYNLPIVLIPHVFKDDEFMKDTLRTLSHFNKIMFLNPNLNASQMKWVISKSKLLIAARTHATIAGFSTATPTLSLGYSIKSKGLNKLLFNNENYLLYCREINVQNVLEKVDLILKDEKIIREKLIEKQVEMKKQALNAGKILFEYIEKKV